MASVLGISLQALISNEAETAVRASRVKSSNTGCQILTSRTWLLAASTAIHSSSWIDA